MEKSSTDNKFLGTEKVGKLLRMFAIPCVLIADTHLAEGNYDKIIDQVAKERQNEKELQAYARILSARIHAGEDPQDVVSDMKNDEFTR